MKEIRVDQYQVKLEELKLARRQTGSNSALNVGESVLGQSQALL
jgi:hypothetical protein